MEATGEANKKAETDGICAAANKARSLNRTFLQELKQGKQIGQTLPSVMGLLGRALAKRNYIEKQSSHRNFD